MCKIFKSETKASKRNYVGKAKRNHSRSRNKVNQIKKDNKLKKIKNNIISLIPPIIKLIDSLTLITLDQSIYDNITRLNIPFPSNIDFEQFNLLFEQGIMYAKKTFNHENLEILQKLLSLLIVDKQSYNDPFGLNSCGNELFRIYKTDLIFVLLSNEQKLKEFKGDKMLDTKNKFKMTEGYKMLDINIFSNTTLFNNNIQIFNDFKNLLFSPTILSSYSEILEKLYGTKISSKKIENDLKDFFAQHNIILILMPVQRYGLTLYDGTIFINRKYYDNRDKIDTFAIYFTLFHEYMHVLFRLEKDDKNFLLNTDEFTKNNITKIKESGEYFDKEFLLNIIPNNSITEVEAQYLLEKDNYAYPSLNSFKAAFKTFRKKKINEIMKLPAFPIAKNSDVYRFSLKVGCRCGTTWSS